MLTRRSALRAIGIGAMQGRLSFAEAPQATKTNDAYSVATLKKVITKLKPEFASFAATSWSRNHPEERPQVLDAYVGSQPNRPTTERDKLYIQPIGEFPEAHQFAIDAAIELLSVTFAMSVKVLKPLTLDLIPASAKRVHPSWGLDQVLSTYVLDSVLKPRRPKDAVAVLGITSSDLWPGKDWNFVFGQASLSERVGVWSLYRFGDPTKGAEERQRFLLRTLKLATHETGHMFGIRHCVHFKCGMNGSNSLDETDESTLAFCPECVAKICWACQVAPANWFADMAKFGERHELAETEIWKRCVKVLK